MSRNIISSKSYCLWGLFGKGSFNYRLQEQGKDVSNQNNFFLNAFCSTNIVFTSSITLFLGMELITSFFQPPIGVACSGIGDNTWHFMSIIWLDTLQSAIMVALVIVF